MKFLRNSRPKANTLRALLAVAVVVAPAAGCRSGASSKFKACSSVVDQDCYTQAASEIEYPAVSLCTLEACNDPLVSAAPHMLSDPTPADYRELVLEDAVRIGLQHSAVLHDLGGTVLRAPDATRTRWDPSIRETDPATGIEAALSAFDAEFTTSVFNEKNDRAINNQFFGGGTRILLQDTSVTQMQLRKRGVTGTEMTLRNLIEFDSNNAPGNFFQSAWTTKVEGEVRHPFLQGGGVQYNRIAGPSTTPGVYNGVLIARANTDVQLAEFEIAVRNLVSNLENAYWDLYFAYRDLDAKIAARDASLETWRRVQALYQAGRRGGEAEKEAQAREQYYRFQEEVQNALSGKLVDGTRTGNGSQGGTFRATGGVYAAERQLRRLMGLPTSDGQLLRPSTEPVVSQVVFDWEHVASEAVERRAELRRQRWRIRRRELEYVASKNHLLPRLDAVGRYRFRGFGDDFAHSGGNNGRFDNSLEDLTTGDFQEWQVGVELSVPIGFRQAHAGVRNAELHLARERAILCDQQSEVVHEVAGAVAEVDRAYLVSQTSYNRLIASREQLDAVSAAFESDKAPLDLLLEAQRKVAEAESRFFRSTVEHALAVKNVHFVKGTLLEYDGVALAEGPWPSKAYHDAADLESRRARPRKLSYIADRPEKVAQAPFDQIRASRPTPLPSPVDVPTLVPAPPANWPAPLSDGARALPPTDILRPVELKPVGYSEPLKRDPASAPKLLAPLATGSR
ncbi:Outer membrane efflux protein [Pseudobythopirellula maris]|uniref:Outer membrane efflux protein n=1 Tax=Pseudobythopirellula maris TaxID=2527991 RepID=A0A5C5ZSX7_9BACT|nr:TolC family protein [Pseudobythopirellula maris]TWT89881.1 Outer membrane efflux protein [Pseudobythopirellula maris]